MARPVARRKKIEAELKSVTSRKGLRTHADAKLVELVIYLNEYPTVILGDFDPTYLALPEEILITVMRGHQKYFAVEDREGELSPHFLAVINLPSDPRDLCARGTNGYCVRGLRTHGFSGKRIRRSHSPTISRNLQAVTYERRSEATATKSSACARSPVARGAMV